MVQRYTVKSNGVSKREDGLWVRFSDYEALSTLIPAPSVAEAAEPAAWLVMRNGSEHKELRFTPPDDLPFNRKTWSWSPLFAHPAPSSVVPSGLEALVERLREIHCPPRHREVVNEAAKALTAALNRIAEIEGETIERAVKAISDIDVAPQFDGIIVQAIEAVRSSATKQEKTNG